MVQLVPMGLKDFFVAAPKTPSESVDVSAALSPFTVSAYPLTYGTSASRAEAMAVPTIARIRNLLCSTVASLPIETYNKFTGAHVEPNRVFNQPDPRVPGSYTYAFVAEDLLFRGVSYGLVMSMYADGRIQDWTRIDPTRVLPQYNYNQTEIIGYQVDNIAAPLSGVGSVIVFYGLDEGVLSRAGKTIKAAAALESAAEMYAKEPVPQMALKSNGTNLTSERIAKLLTAWNSARKSRSTAFLNADVDLQILGIDPAKLQLNEARQYVALELCRALGVSGYWAGAEITSLTYSNAINERKALIDFSLKNILIPIEQRLSQPDFLSSTTVQARYSLDEFLRGSALERAQVYQILNSIGAMSVEQIQEEEDLIK
jgi:HK97 family phage portal protein